MRIDAYLSINLHIVVLDIVLVTDIFAYLLHM